MNKFIFVGRLGGDVECSISEKKGIAYGSILLFIDNFKYNKETGYKDDGAVRIKVFGKSCEFLRDYAHKGDYIAVEGYVEDETYINKNGDKVWGVGFVANRADICWGKKSNVDVEEEPEEKQDEFIPITEEEMGIDTSDENAGDTDTTSEDEDGNILEDLGID